MAAQWILVRDEKRYGPFGEAHLKTLAAAGKLRPADLLIAQGATSPIPAATIPGLFPAESGEVKADATPIIVTESSTATATHSRSKATASSQGATRIQSFWTSTKQAAELAAIAAERQKFTALTLPAAYRALGSHVYRHRRSLQSQLATHADLLVEIDSICAIQPHRTVATATHAASHSFVDSAKSLVDNGKKLAADQQIALKQSSLLCELGKRIYTSAITLPQDPDTQALVQAISLIKTQVDDLDRRAKELQHSLATAARIRIPKRSVVPLIAAGSVLGLLTVAWCFQGTVKQAVSPITVSSDTGAIRAQPKPASPEAPPTARSSAPPTKSNRRKPPPYKEEPLPLNDAIVSLVKADSNFPHLYFVWRDRTGEMSVSDLAASWAWGGGEIEREDPRDWQNSSRYKGPVKVWRPTGSDTVASLTEWLKPYSASRGKSLAKIRATRMSVDGTDCIIVMASAYDTKAAEAAARSDENTPTAPSSLAPDASDADTTAYLQGLVDKEDRKKRKSIGSLSDEDAVIKAVGADLSKHRGRRTPSGESETRLPEATVSNEVLAAIAAYPRLKVIHEMGFLNRDKLKTYLSYMQNVEGKGTARGGENVMLLMMVPSDAWRKAAGRLGMSDAEFRQATNFIRTMSQ